MKDTSEQRCSVISLTHTDPRLLEELLDNCFTEKKSTFLRTHGDWYCNGRENQYVLALSPGEYVGYFALIPAKLTISGEVISGAWLIDIYVLPQYRGRKYETVADSFMREKYKLLIGFPNILAAKIHKKHGWGVRDDLRLQMFPLRPLSIPLIRESRGVKGAVLKAAALLGTPIMLALQGLGFFKSQAGVTRSGEISTAELVALAGQMPAGLITAVRDEAYFKWRFSDAPHAHEFVYYRGTGKNTESEICLITRTFKRSGLQITRIIDLVGAVTDRELLKKVLRAIIRDAARAGSAYVSVISSVQALHSALFSQGFFVSKSVRFCWLSDDREIMKQFAAGDLHLTFADSDNDSVF